MSKEPVVKSIIKAPGAGFSLTGSMYDGTLIVDVVTTTETSVRFALVPRETRRGPSIILRKQAAIDLALAIIKACGE